MNEAENVNGLATMFCFFSSYIFFVKINFRNLIRVRFLLELTILKTFIVTLCVSTRVTRIFEFGIKRRNKYTVARNRIKPLAIGINNGFINRTGR